MNELNEITKTLYVWLRRGVSISVVVFGMAMILVIASQPMGVQGVASDLPPRPTPTPVQESDPSAGPVGHDGGFAMLRLDMMDDYNMDQELWTVIQWQDPEGVWHDTNGWQGNFDQYAHVDWHVASEHFGDAPFRWLVYADESRGEMLRMSEEFTLPEGELRRVVVPITVYDGVVTKAVEAEPTVAPLLPSVSESTILPEGTHGAMIRLNGGEVSKASPWLWAVVQWQDTGTKEWHEVEGWRGTFNENGRVEWWVSTDHYRSGPFRWVVYAAQDSSTIITTSPEFMMPTKSRNVVDVTVAIE